MNDVKIFVETDRIIMREITEEDLDAFFEMDSDPQVHTFLGKKPVVSKQEALNMIRFIKKQYVDFGIGRWAIVDKASKEFVGWGGLKFRSDETNGYINYYEIGYRLLRKHRGKGFATESTIASLRYAFDVLNLDKVYAMANVENHASRKALQKSGFKITNRFEHEEILCDWFELASSDFKHQL